MKKNKLDQPETVLKFPADFLWGASTASHQIEGGLTNNWSVWETTNAERLATEAPSKFAHWLPVWDEIAVEATNPTNYISGDNSDHYHNWREDVALMKELGFSSYRFTIEWSRVEPREGEFDKAALAHYRSLVDKLHKAKIEPIICLWHWTVPLWIVDKSEWQNREIIPFFNRYAEKLTSLFPDVSLWITLNEPDVFVGHSYLIGAWPPQKKSPLAYWRVLHNLIHAHQTAAATIRKVIPGAQVGIAKHVIAFEAMGWSPLNKLRAFLGNWWWNRYMLDRIAPYSDFIGVNYYFHNQFGINPQTRAPKSDLGWWLSPRGLYLALVEADRYSKPLIITEHGLADRNDTFRAWYIEESIKWIGQAIKDGIDVRGYLHWSLLDNFEWDKGFWPRFGLIEVDYKTKKRTIRPSAKMYAKLIRTLR